MSTEHTVEAALLALSSVDHDHASTRNGVGFNGRDTAFGNSLAQQVAAGKTLTPRQYGTAYRMLKTYKTQLRSFGIDYDQIPRPQQAPAKARQPRLMDFHGGFFSLSFPYLPDLKDDLKLNFPKAHWNPADKVWIVPVSASDGIGKWALANGFTLSKTAQEAIADAAEPILDVNHTDNWRLSWATESNIDVDVPEELELYGFQKADIEYALTNLKPGKGVVFGDQMGLGKTPQSILTLRLQEAYPAIIAMPRVVWLKWAKELQTWTPGLRVALLAGRIVTPKTILFARRFGAEIVRLGQPLPDADIYLIKYPVLYKWTQPVAHAIKNSKKVKRYTASGALKDLDVKGIVFDEAHFLSNETAQRTKAAHGLVGTLNPETRLGLSGTLIPNRHRELVSVLKLMNRLEEVAKDEWHYLNHFCNPNGENVKGPFGFDFTGSMNGDELNRKMRSTFYAQHEKLDRVIDGVKVPGVLQQLPLAIPIPVPAELDNQSRYDQVHEDLKEKKGEYATAMRSLDLAIAKGYDENDLTRYKRKVKKLENEVGVLSNLARKVCGEEKVPFDIEWVQDWLDSTASSEKLIVFGYHRDVNERIAEHFGAPLIYGGQNEATRQEAEDAFQGDPACRLVVCQVEAAGVGINLTAATAIAFVELPYRPGDIDQAIGRAYGRLNDIHGVNVFYLIYYGDGDDSIDEHIWDDVLEPKRQVQKKAVSGA